jgi:hypothetical protein
MRFKSHVFSPASTSRGAEATDGKWPGTAVVSRLKPRRLMQGRGFSKTFSPKLSTDSISLASTINLSIGSVVGHQTTCVPILPALYHKRIQTCRDFVHLGEESYTERDIPQSTRARSNENSRMENGRGHTKEVS